jgi:hypothetical protein
VFLATRFDPVARILHAEPFTGRPLEPNVVYRLQVAGVEDLDGRAMAEPVEIQFETGAVEGPLPEPPEPVSWATVSPILTAHCTGAGCHGPSRAALGLDLSNGPAVRETALGVPSTQVASGSPGAEGVAGARGLVGLPIVDAQVDRGRPETSYLVYKVLGDPHILGDPMPPDAPLSGASIRRLTGWIAGGAPTR